MCLFADKAAYPINAMGIGKAMMEWIFAAKSRTANGTLICGTYRVPANNRDLNYQQYFEQGKTEKVTLEEFTSDNATRLNAEQIKEKLLTTEYVRRELGL